MGLYRCTKCGCVENTALGHFHAAKLDGEPVLCSECHTGTWHGEFPKRTPEEAGYVVDGRGMCSPPGGWPGVGARR